MEAKPELDAELESFRQQWRSELKTKQPDDAEKPARETVASSSETPDKGTPMESDLDDQADTVVDHDEQAVTVVDHDDQAEAEDDMRSDPQYRREIFVKRTQPLPNQADIIRRLNAENAHAANKMDVALEGNGERSWSMQMSNTQGRFDLRSRQWALGMAGPLNNRDLPTEEKIKQVIATVATNKGIPEEKMPKELIEAIQHHHRVDDGHFELTREFAAGKDCIPLYNVNRFIRERDAMRYDSVAEEARLGKQLRAAKKRVRNVDLLLKHENFRGGRDTTINFLWREVHNYIKAAEDLDKATYERIPVGPVGEPEKDHDDDPWGAGDTERKTEPPPLSLQQIVRSILWMAGVLVKLDDEAEKITEDDDKAKTNAEATTVQLDSLKKAFELLVSKSEQRFGEFMASPDQHDPEVSMEERLRKHQKVLGLHKIVSVFFDTLSQFAKVVEKSREDANTDDNRAGRRRLWSKMSGYGQPLPGQEETNTGNGAVPHSGLDALLGSIEDLERRLESERSKVKRLETAERARRDFDTQELYDTIDAFRGDVAQSLKNDVLDGEKHLDTQVTNLSNVMDNVRRLEEVLGIAGEMDINRDPVEVLQDIKAGLLPLKEALKKHSKSITDLADGLEQDCHDKFGLRTKRWKRAMDAAERKAKDDEIKRLKKEADQRLNRSQRSEQWWKEKATMAERIVNEKIEALTETMLHRQQMGLPDAQAQLNLEHMRGLLGEIKKSPNLPEDESKPPKTGGKSDDIASLRKQVEELKSQLGRSRMKQRKHKAEAEAAEKELKSMEDLKQKMENLERENGDKNPTADDLLRLQLESTQKSLELKSEQCKQVESKFAQLWEEKDMYEREARDAQVQFSNAAKQNAALSIQVEDQWREILEHRLRQSEDDGAYTNYDDAEKKRQRAMARLGTACGRWAKDIKTSKFAQGAKKAFRFFGRSGGDEPESDPDSDSDAENDKKNKPDKKSKPDKKNKPDKKSKPDKKNKPDKKSKPDKENKSDDKSRFENRYDFPFNDGYGYRSPEYVMSQALLSHRISILSHISAHELTEARDRFHVFKKWFWHVDKTYPWAHHTDWMESFGALFFMEGYLAALEAWGERQAGRDWKTSWTEAASSIKRAMDEYRKETKRRIEIAEAHPEWPNHDLADDFFWLKIHIKSRKLQQVTSKSGPGDFPGCKCVYRVAHCPRHKKKQERERWWDTPEEQSERDRHNVMMMLAEYDLETLMEPLPVRDPEPAREPHPGDEVHFDESPRREHREEWTEQWRGILPTAVQGDEQEDWQEERAGQSLDEELAQSGEELQEFSDEESVLSSEGASIDGTKAVFDGFP